MNDYRECQTCHGYGGWIQQNEATRGWRGNVAPDPQFDEWVRCSRCDGKGEIQTRRSAA